MADKAETARMVQRRIQDEEGAGSTPTLTTIMQVIGAYQSFLLDQVKTGDIVAIPNIASFKLSDVTYKRVRDPSSNTWKAGYKSKRLRVHKPRGLLRDFIDSARVTLGS